MANAQLAVVKLIWDIILGKTEGVSKVSYFKQKLAGDAGKPGDFF